MSTQVGFVGLGAMGLPMALRLLGDGATVRGYDVRRESVDALVEEGGSAAASAAEAAAGADALFVMVATPQQAEDALGEAAGSLAPGTPVVVLATIGPEAVRRLAERVDRLLDAPVSGGTARAQTGELLIMAGGPEDLFRELEPLLGAIGTRVVHCGQRVGDGQSVKLVNQLLAGVHIAAAAEAIAYAEALGLDPRFVIETIRGGAAASFMLDDRGARMLDEAWTPVHSALDIFVKDLGLVDEAARAVDYEAPLTRAAHALFVRGSEQGLGREDDAGLLRVLRRETSD